MIETEQGVWRLDLHLGEELRRRGVLDHDGEILHLPAELGRNGVEGLSDETLESCARHGDELGSESCGRRLSLAPASCTLAARARREPARFVPDVSE